ncbi:MAG TPA: tetratricopeptide repeat protein [Bradyrhizobium sp.]|uniref:tetratricopeptide repeat protein n=1 Tax=Bradyrhizobium sp. TaxID=376 RepID=UPI002D7F1001|nr:tetratricopeptide repeat protein [Bradyrhizobium sp.]HET7885268.1 tetratricopeptide repeat protein [Bradyrhizobium sp.]
MTASPNDASRRAWAPRLAQEAQLAALERQLASSDEGERRIQAEIERAALLAALDRRAEAQAAFIDILRRHPTHFSALNEFGTLLAAQGAIDAACRVYAEAILHHPANPMAHVNLGNLLLRANRHAEARAHYEAALTADPDHAAAHQGMGAVLSDEGDRDGARQHFKKGFRGHAVSTLPYRGEGPPIALLQLVSSGGGNIPTAPFLDDCVFLTTVVVADHLDPATPLPPHRLIFNAIGDADLCRPALEAAIGLTARSGAPVVNDPRAVMKTGRIDNAALLAGLPGVRTARTLAVSRADLVRDQAAGLAVHGFTFPLLLRSPGYHTGRNFVLVETAANLSEAIAGLPGEELLAIEYLDARGVDGNVRKYRVMMIGGKLFPLHLAISKNWKVHYFTSDMADQAGHRSEEMAFLEDMAGVLGEKAFAALHTIAEVLALDYGGIDFGLNADGDLLLFEANATMVIAAPADNDPRWAYRRSAIAAALEAVVAMIKEKAALAGHSAG